jgi:hypothetical protein
MFRLLRCRGRRERTDVIAGRLTSATLKRQRVLFWVRTARQECLDHLIPINERHLRRVLAEFVDYYNHDRPHRTLGLQAPSPRPSAYHGRIAVRPVLGGLHHVYERAVCRPTAGANRVATGQRTLKRAKPYCASTGFTEAKIWHFVGSAARQRLLTVVAGFDLSGAPIGNWSLSTSLVRRRQAVRVRPWAPVLICHIGPFAR